MLEDRDYMRQPRSWRWSATVMLVVALVAAYILQITVLPAEFTARYLQLSLRGVEELSLWQFVTYQFLHGGLIHLLLNAWALYVFGREVEAALGKAQFITLYFFSGIAGGLLHVLAAWQ